MQRRTAHRVGLLVLVCVLAAMLVSACGGSSGSGSGSGSGGSGGSGHHGGTVTFAENQSSGPVNWIFPLVSLQVDLPSNTQFINLQYEPLYWFGQNGNLGADPSLSLAKPPVFGDGGRSVSITLKPAHWSDGVPVTSRDVEFFINLARAYESSWAYFVKGEFPANVSSVSLHGPTSLTLHLTRAYSPTWFTQAQLSELYAFPQHVWDRTSAGGKVGNADSDPKTASKVLAFLLGQAKNTSTYLTNPLWHVVDGPWRLAEYHSDGYAAMTPNPRYDIGAKPTIARFVMEPFTSDAAEANELQTGGITYGYVPLSDLAASSRFTSQGYGLKPWPLLSISYIVLNFNNPAIGPALHQLYVRQAMQSLINEPGYISSYLTSAGIPSYGPVPIKPATPYSGNAGQNPYPYSPSHAVALLQAHGWKVVPNGATTCARPGSGASECGPGIRAGTPLKLAIQYVGGLPYLSNMMQTLKSAMSAAGIDVSLSTGTESQVVGTATACSPGPSCSWQAVQWGTPAWIWSDPYPSGEQLFATGAGVNAGSFSDPTVDRDIAALQTAPTAAATATAWSRYQSDVSRLLPVLWFPNTVTQVSAIASNLHNVGTQNPLGLLAPSTWSLG